MTKEEKSREIDVLTSILTENKNIYLADISGLDAGTTSNLRRLCFNKQVSIQVVKNTLLRKAMEKTELDFSELYDSLKGNTSLMISETSNAPAKVIKEFRKKSDKPILKGAFVEEAIYVGDEMLEVLENLKSKEELIGDVIMLLQSPAKNVVSGLKSAGGTIAGILKTLEERGEAA
jgi:large subunit ribosomal protein L10